MFADSREVVFFSTVETVRLDGWDPPLLINVKGTESVTQCYANTTHWKDVQIAGIALKINFYLVF